MDFVKHMLDLLENGYTDIEGISDTYLFISQITCRMDTKKGQIGMEAINDLNYRVTYIKLW